MITLRHFDHAIIVNVVDGDTCDIELDLGFSVKIRTRFRLIHINCPERGMPGWAEATAFLKQYEGQAVVVESYKTDKYGRYLANLTHTDGVLNQIMLTKGLAVPYL